MKIKLEHIDSWSDKNEKYVEVAVNKHYACCVKMVGGLTYIMQCDGGKELYSRWAGADFPLRNITDHERESVIKFAKKYI